MNRVRMEKAIVATYNVLVFALLVTMYFTDPEQGGMLAALILFFTVLYDIYFWIIYWIMTRFVKRPKVRKWGMLTLAILPFVPVCIVGMMALG